MRSKFQILIWTCGVMIAGLPLATTAAADSPSQDACTTSYKSNTVDGSALWTEVPQGEFAIYCQFHQLGWNNFLYLVADVDGHPRFMSFAPWYDALPATREPVLREGTQYLYCVP